MTTTHKVSAARESINIAKKKNFKIFENTLIHLVENAFFEDG